MAKTDNLGDFLTDVANAIRTKKGTSGTINAQDFSDEIASIPSGGGGGFTGHYDSVGLASIGWSNDEIQYYQDNGVQWDEEYDDVFKLTTSELAGDDSSTTRFLPKNTTKLFFQSYEHLIAIPKINTSSVTDSFNAMFNNCYSLITIPELGTSSVTTFRYSFNCCYSLKNIPNLDASNCKDFDYAFRDCYSLTTIPELDTSSVTTFTNAFDSCVSLKVVPQLNTGSSIKFSAMFNNCKALITVPELDASSCKDFSNMFLGCNSLMNFGGLKNVGQAFSTSVSAGYYKYTLNFDSSYKLSHDSLMNIINNLYDIASKGVPRQILQLGSTNYNKLTSEEIAIATNKGWNVTA